MAYENEEQGVGCLMIGTGEYTTGYAPSAVAESDKGAGVVAITLFDLRRTKRVGRLGLCGVNGRKFPSIRQHIQQAIAEKYGGLDCQVETFPDDDTVDEKAYLKALDRFKRGDAVTVFTPDDTHFEITMAAVERGMHVLTTKPLVKTLDEHKRLIEAARKNNVLVMCEVHKRFDPIYVDARDRIQRMGDFSYMVAYMSQPKTQLLTFKTWAGRASDISYYLNSHHIDFHEWCTGESSRPIRVTASPSTGVSKKMGIEHQCEDTITLMVQWENKESGSLGTAVYTSSWIAPKGEVHSQQRFFYMGHKGEVRVDQAHRGYEIATDDKGYASCNPLFMKYTPNPRGEFAGQLGYGYRSIESFIDAVKAIQDGKSQPADFDSELPTVVKTILTTTILEAGRISLDKDCAPVRIKYDSSGDWAEPIGFE